MADLERAARQRAAEASTPFRWRPFLDSVLAHGTPDEIAAGVVYLASDESAFTTGVAHIIDGGWTL